MPVNIFLILGLGLAVGFLSGMFGIGGGFLMTPLLIFIGISPAVVVASVSPQIAASLFTGFLAHLRRGTIDFMLGGMLLVGGVAGTLVGVWIFTLLRSVDQLDLLIALSYVTHARRRRRADGDRGPARHQPRAPRRPRRPAPARQPHLDPRPAAEDALQALAHLYLGHPGLGDRARSSACSGRCSASAAASCWCRC